MQPDAKWGIGVSVRVGGEGWGKADESARTGIFFPTAWVGVPQPAGEHSAHAI